MPNPFTQLRTTRENQQLSVSDVAELTQIEPHYIEALESAEFSKLPDPVYVRGYIRTYARVLNVAPNPLLSHYKKWEEQNQSSMEAEATVGSAVPVASLSRKERSKRAKDDAGRAALINEWWNRLSQNKVVWVAAAVIAVLAIGAVVTWTVVSGGKEVKVVSADSEAKPSDAPAINKQRPRVMLVQTSDSYEFGDVYQVENADQVMVKITAKKPTDIRVRAGGPKGKALFDKRLEANQTMTFNDDKWLSVRLDNPDQVALFANGVLIDTSTQKEVSLYQVRMANATGEDSSAQESME
ncbi:RodZ domain-containing protein [Laceyella tengchongensis]|jgi:cytoskeletal protein RodZ|uniref:RodZ domain-containing protein n=1 Tax=Laceyella tengchongensis TaxID=574699 RepID=UPI0012B7942A|nr:hypothetical protein [Laceyella tengchongensis]